MQKWTKCRAVPRGEFLRLYYNVCVWADVLRVCPAKEVDFSARLLKLYLDSEFTSDKDFVYVDLICMNVIWSMYLHFAHSRHKIAAVIAGEFLDVIQQGH